MNPVEIVYITSAGVNDQYRDRAMRRAVLVPVFGAGGVDYESDWKPEVERLTLGLLSMWRDRVAGLAAADFDWPSPKWPAWLAERRHFLVNCRPSLFKARQASFRPCDARSVCPFCWSRGAGELYDTLEHALFVAPDVPRLPRPASTPERWKDHVTVSPFDLVERRLVYPGGRIPFDTGGADAAPPALDRLIQSRNLPDNRRKKAGISFGRSYEFARCREFGVAGAVEVMRVRPRKGEWRCEFRQLLAVPSSWGPSRGARRWLDDSRLSASWTRSVRVDRGELARLTGRLLEYTKFLLTHPDAGRVAELISARQGRRLSATYGRFRRKTVG